MTDAAHTARDNAAALPVTKPRLESWPLDRLRPYEKNARTHSEAQVEQLAASMREFGFTNPILVADDAGILAGHGRLLAARKLGLEHVPVLVLDHLSEVQRRAYVIADNKLGLNAGWDDALLAQALDELQAEEYNLSILGWGEELPELPAAPDYSVLADLSDEETEHMAAGVKRGIQIEFESQDYENAFELIKSFRARGAYVGMLLVEKLLEEKAKLAQHASG